MKYFPPFRFDERAGNLFKAGRAVPLTHKAAAVLACLIDRPGMFATHAEIMEWVWPKTHVQIENIKALVHELRGALGDDAHPPRFIRSEPSRGYTFLPGVAAAPPPFLSETESSGDPFSVVRDVELSRLEHHLVASIHQAEPHLVIIEGERGIGKTTLCQALARIAYGRYGIRITCGQAAEVWGPFEDGAVLTDAMELLGRQYPAEVKAARAARHPGHSPHSIGGPRLAEPAARPLWELIAAFEDLGSQVPVLVFLEDLQWADGASVEALGAMARRRGSSLCLVATYTRRGDLKTVEIIDRVARELSSSPRCSALDLRPLTQEQIAGYLERRFGTAVSDALAEPMFDAGAGNPSLMVVTVENLVARGGLEPTTGGWRVATPHLGTSALLADSLVDSYQCQIDRMSSLDRHLLHAAATLGEEFTTRTLAKAVDVRSSDTIGRRLSHLAERHLLIDVATRDKPRATDAGPAFKFRHPRIVDLLIDANADSQAVVDSPPRAERDTSRRPAAKR